MGQTVNRQERVSLPANLALLMSSQSGPMGEAGDLRLTHEPSALSVGLNANQYVAPFDPLAQTPWDGSYSKLQPYVSANLNKHGIPLEVQRGLQNGAAPGYWSANASLPGGIEANVNRQDTGMVNVGISKMLNIMGDQQENTDWQGNVSGNATFYPPEWKMKPGFAATLNLSKNF